MSDDKVFSSHEQTRLSMRPAIMGRHGMVVSGHSLASQAGMRILDRGGNAVDAGVAAGICLAVLQSDMVNFAGVAPIMVYSAGSSELATISGVGPWPKAASVDFFLEHMGAGCRRASCARWSRPRRMPGSPHCAITARCVLPMSQGMPSTWRQMASPCTSFFTTIWSNCGKSIFSGPKTPPSIFRETACPAHRERCSIKRTWPQRCKKWWTPSSACAYPAGRRPLKRHGTSFTRERSPGPSSLITR
jgi:hypothetical protein